LGRSEEADKVSAQAVAEAGQKYATASQLYAAGIAKRLARDEEQARSDFQRALQTDPAYWQERVELENSIAVKDAN
jgi:hypothetical protein